MLFELFLDDYAKKNAARKGCVALLKQADLRRVALSWKMYLRCFSASCDSGGMVGSLA